jgi:fumarate hydratase class II
MPDIRQEADSMGAVEIPADRLWGASTQRAVANFPISGAGVPIAVVHALALLKVAAAAANQSLGQLSPEVAQLVVAAGGEVAAGALDAHFPVDCFQTGSGTSTNMNVNEVIANRAAQLAGQPVGHKTPVHPNDHVNRGQSSNDAFPSALHIAAVLALRERLMPAFATLAEALANQASAWREVVKIGRTHLQDATPVTLGQEFGGYAEQAARAVERAERAAQALAELPIGGTAVGTGLNAHPEFAARVCQRLSDATGIPFREASDHFEAQGARDAAVAASGALKTIAVSLSRIANDIRLLGSGPRCGFGELKLPAVQPGSSIMPGKVNPVICEAAIQVAIQVVANDAAVTLAGFGGVGSLLDLNVAMPVLARNLLESIDLLAAAATALTEKCVRGLEADRERCGEAVERSLAMCTSLVPAIGYDRAAGIAKRAAAEGRTVREVARALGVLPEAELERLLDPRTMLAPRPGAGGE